MDLIVEQRERRLNERLREIHMLDTRLVEAERASREEPDNTVAVESIVFTRDCLLRALKKYVIESEALRAIVMADRAQMLATERARADWQKQLQEQLARHEQAIHGGSR